MVGIGRMVVMGGHTRMVMVKKMAIVFPFRLTNVYMPARGLHSFLQYMQEN